MTGSQGDDTGVMESDRGRKVEKVKFYQRERDRETGRQGERERERERGRRKKGSEKVKRPKKENRNAQRQIKKWTFFCFCLKNRKTWHLLFYFLFYFYYIIFYCVLLYYIFDSTYSIQSKC